MIFLGSVSGIKRKNIRKIKIKGFLQNKTLILYFFNVVENVSFLGSFDKVLKWNVMKNSVDIFYNLGFSTLLLAIFCHHIFYTWQPCFLPIFSLGFFLKNDSFVSPTLCLSDGWKQISSRFKSNLDQANGVSEKVKNRLCRLKQSYFYQVSWLRL